MKDEVKLEFPASSEKIGNAVYEGKSFVDVVDSQLVGRLNEKALK